MADVTDAGERLRASARRLFDTVEGLFDEIGRPATLAAIMHGKPSKSR